MNPHKIKTASDVKANLVGSDHFFDRDTMRFFGDRMSSFGVRTVDGKRVMYRKPSAMVNVFGTWKRAGRDFFNAWELVEADGGVSMKRAEDEFEQMVYDAL